MKKDRVRNCRYCGKSLTVGKNWTLSAKMHHKYRCHPPCIIPQEPVVVIKEDPKVIFQLQSRVNQLEEGIRVVFKQTTVMKRLKKMMHLFELVGLVERKEK